ncbi:EamA family transporter [Nocardioides sp. MAH-18]|uniref:EamA family transporter n=1 Tax=Nocardioides agri TaxID=2682843 RepID=A0A6L6Y1W4_9ACTN|nr:DMT family transporter [Nocardioides sp. CGMCC 1.13656]MBA2952413.1 DMT family transporter [Nocardioides sp. CGMCC 1.13656]MVQ51575.1 EamA family transporter [Nocardioides sp. MAH-18]
MSVLLSLLAAASYGLGDFNGGVFSKRGGPWAVSLMAQVGGSVLVVLVALVLGGSPTATDLGWAFVAGVANGFGTAFLYRGLASGRMGVVAPVSGVGAVLVPVVVGLATGERPAPLVWVGVLIALPAIWLVSREPVDDPAVGSGSGLTDGVLAGLGFGTLFAALAQIPEEAGFMPLALNQLVAGFAIVAVAMTLRQDWVPRNRYALGGIISGALGALATGLFQVATQQGYLTVAAVITSLYPAFTVLLAALVLREHVHRTQAYGLALCAGAVVLVATG